MGRSSEPLWRFLRFSTRTGRDPGCTQVLRTPSSRIERFARSQFASEPSIVQKVGFEQHVGFRRKNVGARFPPRVQQERRPCFDGKRLGSTKPTPRSEGSRLNRIGSPGTKARSPQRSARRCNPSGRFIRRSRPRSSLRRKLRPNSFARQSARTQGCPRSRSTRQRSP
jgi:hypothetical protein